MSQVTGNWRKVFSIIWAGQFMSLLSSSLVNFAVIIWLSLETGSAEVLALAAISALLPQSVIGLFSGVFIDRWDRKKTMIMADGFIALCTLVIASLFYFGQMELWYLYLLLGLRSVGSAFHMPAMQASVPLLAPASELMRVAGINQVIQSVSNIAGPALGALAIGLMDIGYVLLFDIAGALFAILSLLFVRIPNPERTVQKGKGIKQVLGDIEAGIRAITFSRGFSLLFLFSIVATFCLMPVAVLFPLLTLKHFQGDTFQMGLIEVVWGVGMLAGGGLLGMLKIRTNKVVLINWMYIILGAVLALSGLLPPRGYAVFVVLTTIGGITGAIYNASFTAIIQEKIDPALLGRVFSMFFSISLFPSLLALMGTGFLADTIGISRTFVILGSAIGLVGILSFLVPEVTRAGEAGQGPA
ncbi:DHA3 family macrolide efflux protein-like MFS transporter [Anseongella ginsenosidimutans]|uniref:DHA3 family macrolide efflux protein-like MFS transporter n=1 Tax=Anseongella ginsenosidimutans TaxID=496056 RepID=A0A4R3KSY7_9SPHI|nr:MFS transporter [Anseongella ginsenosidimutans]QEC53092.1 MFS transporter [Anseongella ginsenosidimutans]TCS87709.1 DHA3 family macrolide efflux protein-like MFS transporter [Anseongella ginsenosidimutans]